MKENIFKGIFGAIIFAIIGSIPWVVYYYVFDGPLFIYGLFIPFGAYNGYKLFHGPRSNHQLTIYTTISIVVSFLCSYAVMPILYLLRNRNEITAVDYFDTFNWIEVRHELFHNYLIMIASVIVGIVIIYTIYIPYLVSKKEDYEYRQKMLVETDISPKSYFLDPNIYQENIKSLKRPIIISIIIILIFLGIFIPKKEFVIEEKKEKIKQVTNEWIEYDIPNNYLIYKYGDANWLVTDVSDEIVSKSGITIEYHTIKEKYNTIDKLFDYLYEGISNDEEADLVSSSKNNFTNNGYQYFEFVVENYRGATHILDYVIDESFEYCAIIECTRYNNNLKIMEAKNQLINSFTINNGKERNVFDFIKYIWNNL